MVACGTELEPETTQQQAAWKIEDPVPATTTTATTATIKTTADMVLPTLFNPARESSSETPRRQKRGAGALSLNFWWRLLRIITEPTTSLPHPCSETAALQITSPQTGWMGVGLVCSRSRHGHHPPRHAMIKTYHHMIPFVINYRPLEELSDALKMATNSFTDGKRRGSRASQFYNPMCLLSPVEFQLQYRPAPYNDRTNNTNRNHP